MTKKSELSGLRFGAITVIGENGRYRGRVIWACKCDCGNTFNLVAGSALKSGKRTSCGCVGRKNLSMLVTRRNTVHGHNIKGHETGTHKSWISMVSRCSDTKNTSYKNYGGRGIYVCDRWKIYENFLADMGERPKGKTLDRIDVDSGYYPENCRWSTLSEQQRNRRDSRIFTLNGVSRHINDWALDLGITAECICARIKRGWSIKDTLSITKNGMRP